MRLLRSSQAADDLSQEATLKALIHINKVKEDAEIVPYTFRIAWNLSHDEQRKAKRMAPGGIDACDPRHTPRTRSEDPTKAALCNTAINCLDERSAVIIRMYYWEGWTTAEIGEKLGLKEGLVQVSMHRARKKMKERIAN